MKNINKNHELIFSIFVFRLLIMLTLKGSVNQAINFFFEMVSNF